MHTAGATQSCSGERRAASQGLQELCEEARRIRADGKWRQGVLETRADVDGGKLFNGSAAKRREQGGAGRLQTGNKTGEHQNKRPGLGEHLIWRVLRCCFPSYGCKKTCFLVAPHIQVLIYNQSHFSRFVHFTCFFFSTQKTCA